MSIYASEVEEAIVKLEKSGVDVIKEDYVVYAGKYTEFDEGLFPLPIIILNNESMPDNVAFIVARKVERELQTVPPVIIDGGSKKK